ncbi:sensor histidine kinase [Paenibacillus sp. YSY-4.3]
MKFYHTLFAKLFVSFFILFTVLLLFLGWITYRNSASSLNRQLNSEAESTFNRNFKVLSIYLNDLNRMSDAIAMSSVVSDFLKNRSESDYYASFPRIDDIMKSANSIRPENTGITLVSSNQFVYYYGYSLNRDNENFSRFDWLPEEAQLQERAYVTPLHLRPYSNLNSGQKVFSFVRKLHSIDLRATGLLIIDFDLDALSHLFSADPAFGMNESEDSLRFYIQDQQGTVVYPHNEAHHTLPGDLSKYRLVQRTEPTTGWTMSAYFLENKWYEPVYNIRKIFVSAIIVSLLIGAVASLFISTRFSRPIKQLRLLMKEVEQGNFDEQFQITAKDEIGLLGIGYNKMVKKIKDLIELVYTEQNHKRIAEVAALQAQINPHFLYNTLESINSLARQSKEKDISKMIVLLGKLLRISISSFEELVPFSKELEYLRLYLEIHQLRLKKQISYTIQVEEEIYDLYTVKWIFQPILENAIMHGLDPKQNGGCIEVKGWIEDDVVWIVIQDYGVGMDKEELKPLQEALANDYEQLSKKQEHIGLFNVQARIKYHFGTRYGIMLDSDTNRGMKVTIMLPRREHG